MKTSDTPRTDCKSVRFSTLCAERDQWWVPRETALQLERQLATVTANALALSQANAELRSQIRRLEEAGDKLHWAFMHPFDPARYDLPKLWIEAKAKP